MTSNKSKPKVHIEKTSKNGFGATNNETDAFSVYFERRVEIRPELLSSETERRYLCFGQKKISVTIDEGVKIVVRQFEF